MARVPYSDSPQVEPQLEAPNDYQHVDASPRAFGSDLAQGGEALGQGASTAVKFWGQIQTDQGVNDANDQATKIVENFKSLKGQDALDAQKDTESQLKDIYSTTRSGLKTREQQLQFDNSTRSFYQRFLQPQVYTHANQQATEHGLTVNEQAIKTNYDVLGSLDPKDPDYSIKADHAIDNVRQAAEQSAHLKLGASASVDDVQGYVRPYLQGALKTQAQSMAVTDPDGASKFIDKYRPLIGVDYHSLSSQFKTAANQQRALGVFNDAMTSTAKEIQGGASANGTAAVREAILQQESGDLSGAPTSVTGAVGPGQMMPDTFKQFAQPGEDINNPRDNRAAMGRYIQHLSDLPSVQGDPARIAVGYFSGPGNIAPANSPTPWIADLKDPNGKSVSSYVQDVSGRLTGPGHQLLGARASVYDKIMDAAHGNPMLEQAAFRMADEHYRATEIASLADQKARTEQQDQAMRGYGDNIRTGAPNFSWRNDKNLTETQVEHLDDLALKHLKGDSADWGPGGSDVQQKIFSGQIKNQEQLLSFTAGPKPALSPTGYFEMSKALGEVNKPGAEADRILQSNFYKSAEKAITLESELVPGLKRSGGDEKWRAALPVLNQALKDGRTKGLSNNELMDPENKNSVWDVLKPWLPTKEESDAAHLQDAIHADGQAAGAAPFDWQKISTLDAALDAYNKRMISKEQARALVGRNPGWGVTLEAPAAPGAPPQVPTNGDAPAAKSPGLLKQGNLDPFNRPTLKNADGTTSTTSSISIGTDQGEVLIPTVVDGKRLSNQEAIEHYKKTGQHFGIFDTPEHADAFATDLHNRQADSLGLGR